MPRRSHLYVPGNRPDRYEKACSSGADCVIVDLEDAVPDDQKDQSLAGVIAWLVSGPPPVPVWVRVNAGPRRMADVAALACVPSMAGLCLAKTSSESEVDHVHKALEAVGSQAALAPLIEDAEALLRAQRIASAPRVVRLQLGESDLCADLGITLGSDERELLWARSLVVAASAAAGIGTPVGSVYTRVHDEAGLRASTEALSRLGFRGRTCVHPRQVAVINQVFTPPKADVQAARTLLAAVEASDGAAFLDESGRMVDPATVRTTRRVAESEGPVA